ncbi:MAG: hypothetical protein L6Q76_08645 [Polyangiaceae bacterium]|nr:hypothetical protein [Polyangiaceae bacterium]
MRIPSKYVARPSSMALFAALALTAASGCGGNPAPAHVHARSSEPAKPPPPKSDTKANPVDDADDPERATLEKLLNEPWGFRKDRWDTLRVPLADWKNWKRVRIWGHPTRATYRYGDNHHAIDTTLYTPSDGPNDLASCLAKFTQYASTTAQAYGVRMSEPQLIKMNQQVEEDIKPMLVELRDGTIDSLLAVNDYVGALAVYPSFPGTCLVRGFAVVATNHRELALKVRERWVREAAPGIRWDKKVKEPPATESR